MSLTAIQNIVHYQIWRAIDDGLCDNASWDDIIKALEQVKNTAESNKEFGLLRPYERSSATR